MSVIGVDKKSSMKIGKGVEWAAHTCALLAMLPANAALPKDALADFLGVPGPYLAKQMQMLSAAGIVAAKRGVAGGYQLARLAETISLWEITAAIEGTSPSFRCTEIRQNGPCGVPSQECSAPCTIAASFRDAEERFRQSLSGVMLSSLVESMTRDASPETKNKTTAWLARYAAVTKKEV